MIIQQFGSILIKIKNNNPISKSDVFDNIYLIRKKGIDLNYKEKVRPHYYYEPGNSLEIIKAVRNHNNRVDIWNKRHPYEIAEIKVTSDILPYPYPIIIRGITVSDKELFKSLHNDMDIFVKTFNKTILIYFKNKLEIAKNIEVNLSATEEYNGHIRAVNKWFLDNDINPDETESFFDEDLPPFERNDIREKTDNLEGLFIEKTETSRIKESKDTSNDLPKNENKRDDYITKYEQSQNEQRVMVKKIKELSKKVRKRTRKLADYSEKEFINRCDKYRHLTSGKLNFKKIAEEEFGVHADTVKNEIINRKLRWLIDDPAKYVDDEVRYEECKVCGKSKIVNKECPHSHP